MDSIPQLAPGTGPPVPGAFRLMRFFTLSTLVVFAAVAVALFVLQRKEEVFFEQVQREQRSFFARAQAELSRQHEAAALARLLAVNEASHVALTRVVANLMWAPDIAPFLARTQRLPVLPCRALDKDERRACLDALGRGIRALPEFGALDRKAYAAMNATRVFKIKVWDLRGVAVYSSEHAQIGDDGASNAGWRAAVAGQPASELTHRDRFSAFEGVVENRDLISSYVPVRDASGGAVVGVLELYSDVTPFLDEIKAASRQFADIAAANEAQLEAVSRANEDSVDASSQRFLFIVGGLLVVLYAASLLIVAIGQRFIDRQSRSQQEAARREHLWHREKMAALSTMAVNVSHEVGNPLAVIALAAQQLPEAAAGEAASASKLILEQTARIAQLMRRISDFSAAHHESAEWVDVGAMVKAVCDFHAFDRRFRGVPIEYRGAAQLPARQLVADQLNELMMNLLQAVAESGAQGAQATRVLVETLARADDVVVRVGFEHAASKLGRDGRFEVVRRCALEMGARLTADEAAIEITLPRLAGAAPG